MKGKPSLKKTEFKPNEGERFPVDFLKVFFICFAAVHFLVHFLETIGFFAGSGWLLSGKLRHMACFPILCPESIFLGGSHSQKEISSQSFRLELFWFLAFPLHKKGLKTKRCTAGNPLQGFIWDFCPNAVKNISARRLFICSVLEADQELGLVIGDQPMCKPLKNGVHSNRNQDRVWAGLSWNFSD